jgi:tetratricopeptide (TPR) repeat protein
MRFLIAAAVLAVAAPRVAAADGDDLAHKLAAYENEARLLGTDLPKPDQLTGPAGRRLVDAEVSYALGDYDTAALVLFDLVGKLQGADAEAATYYLAEALLQKGDRGAARTYFKQVTASGNVSSKYYQPALERLVEIAIAQRDNEGVDDALGALDRISAGLRLPSVPYVRGKYAFSQGKYDEALAFFADVPRPSDYEAQAAYYTATTQVAKKDLAKATDLFTDLINRKPRTSNDRRVIELGQLALGRLYYEREQPSKSIDSYLLVDRHSDLFPDALYEVAWVYVKSKQYDKALRALELLELSDPQSTKTPTVRILEGNLRIRKAQMIRGAQVAGTINPNETSDPATEYDKASKLFIDTHDQYMPSYLALTRMVDGNLDPASFVEQVAGRSTHVFQVAGPIPEAAAQWLRDDPEVQRFVSVENDLGDIQSNIRESQETVARLEGVIAAPDHSSLYPRLASRRSRIAAIQDDLVKLRSDLADQELRLVDSSGDLSQLSATRKQLAQQYAALGNPEQAYADRINATQAGYDKVDQDAAEIDAVIDSTQAVAVALRTYTSTDTFPADQRAPVLQTLDDAAREAQAIEDELAEVHREVVLGKDLAGVGDEGIGQARAMRKQLKAAQDAEHRVLAGFASASRDKSKSTALAGLGDRAGRIAATLDETDGQISALVEQGLVQAKTDLAQARTELEGYKQDLATFETDSRQIGGTVLGASFKDVKAKFYDVIIRTDVGTVDVSWSQKEDNDDDLKRLNLARARELKQLKDEFKDILEDKTPKPTAPKKSEIPPPTEGAPTGSPDKGTGKEERVKPVGDTPKGPTQPSVQPDEKPKAGAPPKKTGANK